MEYKPTYECNSCDFEWQPLDKPTECPRCHGTNTGRQAEGPIEERDRLRAEPAAMTAERDSEQRWANQYHQEAERLQAELQQAISEFRKRKGWDQDIAHWRERAEAAEDELQQAREWIAVSERLPEQGQRVMCYSRGAGSVMALFLDNLFRSDYDGYAWRSISHWRPLPEPPQEDNG